jgi:hypothetical protein
MLQQKKDKQRQKSMIYFYRLKDFLLCRKATLDSKGNEYEGNQKVE